MAACSMDEAKPELVRARRVKAPHDLATAEKLSAGQAILDTANLHCQQAAEKAIKGSLVWRDIPEHRKSAVVSARFRRC